MEHQTGRNAEIHSKGRGEEIKVQEKWTSYPCQQFQGELRSIYERKRSKVSNKRLKSEERGHIRGKEGEEGNRKKELLQQRNVASFLTKIGDSHSKWRSRQHAHVSKGVRANLLSIELMDVSSTIVSQSRLFQSQIPDSGNEAKSPRDKVHEDVCLRCRQRQLGTDIRTIRSAENSRTGHPD